MTTYILTITLKSAKAHHACESAFTIMQEALGPGHKLDDPFPLLRVLEVRGLKDTLWALRCVPREQADEKRRVTSLWLADILERVEGKMRDERSRAIIPLLREHAINPVGRDRWRKAYAAAYDAAYAAADAAYAAHAYAAHAYAAAYDADAAYAAAYDADAAYAAAYAAAAAYDAAYAAADAAYAAAAAHAAANACVHASYGDAYADEREWQTQRLRYYLTKEMT